MRHVGPNDDSSCYRWMPSVYIWLKNVLHLPRKVPWTAGTVSWSNRFRLAKGDSRQERGDLISREVTQYHSGPTHEVISLYESSLLRWTCSLTRMWTLKPNFHLIGRTNKTPRRYFWSPVFRFTMWRITGLCQGHLSVKWTRLLPQFCLCKEDYWPCRSENRFEGQAHRSSDLTCQQLKMTGKQPQAIFFIF